MGTASGVFKRVAYKRETAYGVLPGATGGAQVRRVTSSLDLTKDTYASGEVRPDFQTADMRHGVRRSAGTISGELSAKTYAEFFAAALKRDFTAGVSIAGLSVTIAAGALVGGVQSYTVSRAAGDFIADGFKVGDVVELVGAFNAANLTKNMLVIGIPSALSLQVLTLNGTTLTPEGPIAASTVRVRGGKTYIPQTGHVDLSFTIEHWFSDVPTSEAYTGQKVGRIAIGLPPTGMATIGIDFAGKDVVTGSTAYFTAPAPLTTTGAMAAVNGVLLMGGLPVANVTGLTIDMACGLSGDPVVGSNTIPFQSPGRVAVTGSVTAQFNNTVQRDAFFQETEQSLIGVFTENNSNLANIICFNLSRIKVSGAGKDDGEKTIIMTIPFTALLDVNGGAGKVTEMTTISIQDSAVTTTP